MAYYKDAPQKKRVKVDYANRGSWDEEGTHYRNSQEKDRNAFRKKDEGYSDRDRESLQKSPIRSFKRNHEQRKNTGRDTAAFRNPEERSAGFNGRSHGLHQRSRQKSYEETAFRSRYRDSGGSPNRENRPAREYLTEEKPAPKDYRDYEYKNSTAESVHPEEENDRILCGRNPIREALRSGREIDKLLVQKGELNGSAREIVAEARNKKIMVQEVDKRRLDEIALHHQGLIAFAAAYRYAEVEEMLAAAAEKEEAPFLIILDGVTDPHNLGAIIRTAECAGAHGVIIPLHRSVGLTPAAVKASAGAVEHMKVARVINLNRTIEDLKKQGIWTYALDMDGTDYEKVNFQGGTALVIGAEGEGISRLTGEICDMTVSLPMKGALDSLNASVAAGIMMYRVLSCRKKG